MTLDNEQFNYSTMHRINSNYTGCH